MCVILISMRYQVGIIMCFVRKATCIVRVAEVACDGRNRYKNCARPLLGTALLHKFFSLHTRLISHSHINVSYVCLKVITSASLRFAWSITINGDIAIALAHARNNLELYIYYTLVAFFFLIRIDPDLITDMMIKERNRIDFNY